MNAGRPCRDDAAARALQALAAALREDDLDRAIDLGLLAFDPNATTDACTCAACDTARPLVGTAREARLRALAARERYRARNARLALHAQARAERRAPAPAAATAPAGLPSAAAAALARAKAKAASRT